MNEPHLHGTRPRASCHLPEGSAAEPGVTDPASMEQENPRARIPLAVYREPDNSDEIGNPWILAMERPIESARTLRKRLTRFITITDDDRSGTRLRRMQLLLRQRRFVHPLGWSRVCYENAIIAILEGYATRNPFAPAAGNVDDDADTMTAPSTGLGGVILGGSGMGKSTTIEVALSLIAQVVEHSRFQGRAFCRYQILWLKVNAGSNAKEFIERLIREIDRLLGTSYHAELCRSTISRAALAGRLLRLLEIHGVGLICIDDIQNLFIGTSTDQAQTVEILTRIVNIQKIPLFVVGTEESLPLFDIRFDTARRLSGLPSVVMAPLEDGPEWTGLCGRLWDMRVVRVQGAMPAGFSRRLLELSRGITDFAVKLVFFAQHRALAFGLERLDSGLLEEVYEIAIILVRAKLKNLGDDAFERYGEEHRDALDPNLNKQLLAALTAVRRLSAVKRADARDRAAAPVAPEKPPQASSGKPKARRSGAGGAACALGVSAGKDGLSVHAAMSKEGLVWKLGEAAAAA